jgi:iron complex transport system permease protein
MSAGSLPVGRLNALRRPGALLLLLLIGCALLLSTAIWSLCVGRYPLVVETVLRILASRILPIAHDWSDVQERIVVSVRAPRVMMAMLAGAGLAMAGAAMQGVFRNPLVSPHILGVSSGASFGGALAILLGLTGFAMIGSAFVAGCLTLMLVAMLARVAGRSTSISVVLTGIIVGSLFGSLVSLLKFVADADSTLPAIVFWLMGSFASSSWDGIVLAGPAILVALAVIYGMRFRINVLSLGEEEARALGIPTERDRWIVFLGVCLVEGAVVAFCGVIGWVGLIIPHAARMLVGADQRVLLPASALLGAIFMVLVDTLARSVTAAEIPVGILTSIIGAPVFAALLRRRQKAGERL